VSQIANEKITTQVFGTALTPSAVGREDQIFIRRVCQCGALRGVESSQELFPGVDACICCDPEVVVAKMGLRTAVASAKWRFSEADIALGSNLRANGRNPSQKRFLDRAAIKRHDANNGGHRAVGTGGKALKRSWTPGSSMRTTPSCSTQACAMSGPVPRTPMRSSLTKPCFRNIHCTASAVARHLDRSGPCRAAAATNRDISRASAGERIEGTGNRSRAARTLFRPPHRSRASTIGKSAIACRNISRCAGGRRRKWASLDINDVDKPLLFQPIDQVTHVSFKVRRIHVELVPQEINGGTHGWGAGEDGPKSRPNGIEAKVGLAIQVQDYQLPLKLPRQDVWARADPFLGHFHMVIKGDYSAGRIVSAVT
jgi:hypothetical protein